MKQLLLTLAAALLLAGTAYAQPGEDKAAPSAKATPTEKAAAKATRKAAGKEVAKAAQPGDDRPASASKTKVAKSERKLAAAKRKAEGKKISKEPKEVTGTNN